MRYMIALSSVKAVLKDLQEQTNIGLSTPPSSASDPLSLSSTSALEPSISSSHQPTDISTLDILGAGLASSSSESSSTRDSPVEYGSPSDALRFLVRHALHALNRPVYHQQQGLVSRAYLLDLASTLVSFSMINEARKLVSTMKSSPHFQPTEKLVSILDSTHSPHTASEIVKHFTRIEREHGTISDHAIVSAFEPFLRLQDQTSVKALFSSLKHPSTVACNLYLRSLLTSSLVSDANALFQRMLEENRNTMGSSGADSNTFAILMYHYSSVGDISRIDRLAELLLSNQYTTAKQLHFELILQTFLHHAQLHKAISIARRMFANGIEHLETTVAEGLMWACAQTKQFSVGIQLHRSLRRGPSTDSRRYLKAVHLCFLSYSGIMSNWDKTELEYISDKLRLPETASNTPSTPSPPTIPSKRSSKKLSSSARTVSSNQVDPPFTILSGLLAHTPLDVPSLVNALKMHASDSVALLQAFKRLLDTLGPQIPPEATQEVLAGLRTPDELSLALSWLTSSTIATTSDTLVQYMRSYYLQISHPHVSATERRKLYNSMRTSLDNFRTTNNTENNIQGPNSWLAQMWVLKSMYATHHTKEALALLESDLPTLAELAIAPTTYFLPESATVVSASTKSENGKPTVSAWDMKRAEMSRSPTMANGNRNDHFLKLKPREKVEKHRNAVNGAEVKDEKVRIQRFKVPAPIAFDFYSWCQTCDPPVVDKGELMQRRTSLVNKTERDLLSPQEVRELFSAVQMARRQQQASSKTTKDGYKLFKRQSTL